MEKLRKILSKVNLKSGRTKAVIALSVVAVVVLVVILGQIGSGVERHNTPPHLISLQRTDLVRTISASGVVQSVNSQNVFSTQNSPVREIYVSVGDRVQVGDVLASLDMTRLERDIAQAELNLQSALMSADEELRSIANAVVNAETSLEASRISLARQATATSNAALDLSEIENDIEEPFDSSLFDRMIEDAETNLIRRLEDLEDARENLNEALYDFDDFIFLNAIDDARTNVARRQSALRDAEDDFRTESLRRIEPFDDRAFVQAIRDAERNLSRRREDLAAIPGDPARPEGAFRQASLAVEEAQALLNRTRLDMEISRDNHYSRQEDLRRDIVSAAETVYENAKNALQDAQRAYDRAQEELQRARRNAAEAASDALTRAENNVIDAQRALERALQDKERAISDHIDSLDIRLRNAARAHRDSRNQLEAAENNLRSAQNALEQTQERPITSDISVELQIINLQRLREQLEEGQIVATADGVITAVNASVGAVPAGVLFVIEDIDNLLVSVNVREHNLQELALGQSAYVTTVATGDRTYGAMVTHISPRAVSPPGSTSVEFEVQAEINGSDQDIRIGMNAFLNVITDSRENVFAIPLTAIISDGQGDFVFVYENGERVGLPVTIGLRTSTSAEIVSNALYEGMQILARPLVI